MDEKRGLLGTEKKIRDDQEGDLQVLERDLRVL